MTCLETLRRLMPPKAAPGTSVDRARVGGRVVGLHPGPGARAEGGRADAPSSWPALVHHRGKGVWQRHDCGMAEFLVRILRADFPANRLSDLALWGRHPALLLSESEEERLLEQGIDPWAG
ncbi:hypothetical protein ACWFR1_20445 [Streptomyces sp. NPDC055103]